MIRLQTKCFAILKFYTFNFISFRLQNEEKIVLDYQKLEKVLQKHEKEIRKHIAVILFLFFNLVIFIMTGFFRSF